MLGTCEYTG